MLAAIFRDVLIWSVHNGQPVTMIHVPAGLLNGIFVVAPLAKSAEEVVSSAPLYLNRS